MVAVCMVALAFVASAAALPKVPVDKFEPVENCGCHAAFMETWNESMHAKALIDPLYRYKLDEANKATDGAIGPFCEACHGAVAVMAGLSGAPDKMPPQARQGVTCDLCHQVIGTSEPLGNTSLKVKPDGPKRAQFRDAKSPYHKTVYSQFHETAEFCGMCHNVNHPGNGMHLEATYTEWKNGPYAAQGTVCQDCHMTPGPGVVKPYPGSAAAGGPQRDHIYIMTFAGGNVGLGDAERAEERLKAAATLEMELPDIFAPGTVQPGRVTITNSGAGHYLPTGLTEIRRMLLEVVATDSSGAENVIGTHEFGSVLKDEKGNAPAELWEAVAFSSDDRIPPKESVTDTFDVLMPEDGSVTVTARLTYRSAPEEMAEAAGVEIPTTLMASTAMTAYGSEKSRKQAASESDGTKGGGTVPLWVVAVGLIAFVSVVVLAVLRFSKGSAG